MSRPALLFLTQRLPYPPNKGEKIRQFHILNYVRQWYDVHLGCLLDDPADRQHVATVRALCRDLHVATINPRIARVSCLRGLLTGEPLSVVFFRDRALRDWSRDVLARVRPAVTVVISSNMAQYILDEPGTELRIVDLVDVDSEKWRAYATKAAGPTRWVYAREWRKVAALERRIAAECDLASFVSQAEADLFASMLPEHASRVRGVSNGVDFRYFDPAQLYEPVYDAAGSTFVFTGTMDYPPNIDAVTWFADEVFPALRRTHPDARFSIVGAHPTSAVRALGQRPGIVVAGRVADVRPYLAHAVAAVAPMRIARGIQNKVLEAMAMAKPAVVTPGSLEGIEAVPGQHLILAGTAADMIEACERLIADPDHAASIGSAARRLVKDRYDWSVRLARYDDVLRPGATS